MSTTMSSSFASRLIAAVPYTRRSAIINTVGPEGSGKTGWALTAPDPLLYIPMDRRLAGDYINGLLQTRKIYVPKTNFKALRDGKTNQFSQAEAVKMWDELNGLTHDGFKESAMRTIVLDTGGYAWELLRMARFGKLTQVMPHHYGPVNAEFETLLYRAEEYGKILILIHKQKKEYKAGKDNKDTWTGRWERQGYNSMGFVANISIEHFRRQADLETGVTAAFGARVLQNKLQPSVDGREYVDDECTFDTLGFETWGDSYFS